jgi:hypothetical protein
MSDERPRERGEALWAWQESRGFVKCDTDCGAREDPKTLRDLKLAIEHYKHHSYMQGCSHGH